MTELSETQLRRLPNYARVNLERLQRRVEELEARLAVSLGDMPDDSLAFLNNGYSVPRTPLGANAQVSFFRTPAEAAEDHTWGRLDVRRDDQDGRAWVRIMGSRGLVIAPQVTNVIMVSQEGW